MDENDELTLEVTRLRQQYPQAYSKLFNNQSLSTLNLFGFNLAGEGALLEDFDNTYSGKPNFIRTFFVINTGV
jgi:hypothetical protein